MQGLIEHERFEIEVLEGLKNSKLLDPLVFGGGTMLRLCYELSRYSADLDFWFIKKMDYKTYFDKVKAYLRGHYEMTDAQIKHFTLLFEFRSKNYPRKLKLEIRKQENDCDFQNRIAFSRFSTKQVILRVHTLEQTMKNKIEAALDRKKIRDCFDIEFLLRRGIPLNAPIRRLDELKKIVKSFDTRDFKVALGSILEFEERKYYIENGFEFLLSKLT